VAGMERSPPPPRADLHRQFRPDGRQGLPPRTHGYAGPAVPHGTGPRRHRRHAEKIAR